MSLQLEIRKKVLCFEFGFAMFAICSVSLKDPPPWSPPTLTHISSCGMVSLCHVSFPSLLYWSNSCVTSLVMSSIRPTAVGFSTSDLSSLTRMRSTVSVTTSPNIASFCSCLSFFSHARLTPILFKNLFWALCCCQLKPSWVRRVELCLLDTDGCSQFAALSICSLAVFVLVFISDPCCLIESSVLLPEMFVRRYWSNFERFLRRGEVASADAFLGCVILFSTIGCPPPPPPRLTSQCLFVVGLLHL